MNGLELVARIIVEGFMSGGNRSQSIGTGQEFSQYRNYEPGDDLRQLDWKMYARSERYYIKQSEIETNITVKFVLDGSRSMSYTEEKITKLQFAKVLASALAYLARKQGDTFGLYAVGEHMSIVHPKFEQQQFTRFLHALISFQAKGSWQRKGTDQIFDHHSKEMIVFLTDMYDEDGDLHDFISRLKTKRNEVIVFHVFGRDEKTLELNGSFTFKDLESGKTAKVDTLAQKKSYTERIDEWMKSIRNYLLERGIAYETVTMNDDPANVLRDFLRFRKRLIR